MADHPNDVPGFPMVFPPWLERLQIKYINPAMTPIARHLPTVAVIRHTGRKSGKRYETPVSPLRKGNLVAIGLLHGKTNWVRNVLAAGEADIHLGSKDVHLVNPRVIEKGGDTAGLPRAAQAVNKRAGVFVAEIA
jgi:deazaflavin-dependent oxidoreductase (nitroreductase family)